MRVPLAVPPAGSTYIHLNTVSRHFHAETKRPFQFNFKKDCYINFNKDRSTSTFDLYPEKNISDKSF